ncbi:MAG: hypothetical protein HFF16_08505 [Angelakisella sp.]|nr:hypothetical protein [Angelakisella sp.]MCI9529722.1 hypothetical protein [Angelakisella sp.]
MQLINITSTPIEYKINIEPGRLEMKQADNARQKMTSFPSELSIQSRNIEVRLDSTRMRASLNLRNPGEFARYYGSQGMQTAYENIGDRVQFGNQISQIQDGVSISQVVQQKMLEQPTTYTTFIPSAGIDISWQPQQLNLDYQPTQLEFDWQTMKNSMEYVPGKYQMDILQYPKVQIEYLGTPTYVPPSADPNYEEQSA